MREISFLLGLFIIFLSCSKDEKNMIEENSSTTTILGEKLFIEGEWIKKDVVFLYPQKALEKPSHSIIQKDNMIVIERNLWKRGRFETEKKSYDFQLKGSDTIEIMEKGEKVIVFVKLPNGNLKRIIGWSNPKQVSSELIPFEKLDEVEGLK